MKYYKLGGKYFSIDTRFGRFEAFQNKLNELGLNMELAKNMLLGNVNDTELIAQFGVDAAIRLYSHDNLRSILATILVHKPFIYRLPVIGEYLFNKFNKFSFEQIEETKKYLLSSSIAESEAVMNDFFTSLISSMLHSFQSSKG